MSTHHANEEELFHAARALATAERASFLDQACGSDAALRHRLDVLLAADVSPDDPLGPSPLGGDPLLAERPGIRIDRFVLHEKIGEGGCGIVYLAEQVEPVQRRVALKVIKLGMDTREVVARFKAERQTLALMDHPNIAGVLDAGATPSGRPYVAMELVPGLSLTEYCDRHQLSLEERLRLFLPVCHALQHAHQKGIIHRDLKPSNILVATADDQPVPKIIDFGIAKATAGELADRTALTHLHQCLGTPAYMSPEQATLDGADIDTRSDLYSLGVVLYELLAGTTPFGRETLQRASWDEVLRRIRQVDPPRPSIRLLQIDGAESAAIARRRGTDRRRLVARLRGDLDWIVLKCLEKDRNRRYASAMGLAVDLQRHLQHEPVAARPPGTLYRAKKFVRRNRLAVTAATILFVTLAAGLAVSSRQALRATRAEEEQTLLRVRAQANEQTARRAQAREAAARHQAELQTYSAEMLLAYRAHAEGNLSRAIDLLLKHHPDSDQQPDLRGFEWRHLWHLCQEGDAEFTLRAHAGMVATLAFNGRGRLVTAGLDGAARVFDLTTRRERQTFRFGAPLAAGPLVLHDQLQPWALRRVAISADGEVVAATPDHATLLLWPTESETPPAEHCFQSPARRFSLSPDGRFITFSDLQQIWLQEIATGREVEVFPGHKRLWTAVFSTDRRLLAVTQSLRVRLWNLAERRELAPLDSPHPSNIPALAFSPDGRLLATGSSDSKIKLWQLSPRRLLATLVGHQASVWCLAFSPDGTLLASGSGDQNVRLWDVSDPARPRAMRNLRGHAADVSCLAFSPDGRRLASGDTAGLVKLWAVEREATTATLTGHTDWVFAVAFSPGDRRLASAGFDGTIRLWNSDTREARMLVPTRAYDFTALQFSPDGRTLATGEGRWRGARLDRNTPAGSARIWSVAEGREVFTSRIPPAIAARVRSHPGHPQKLEIRAAAFSPDGRQFAGGTVTGTILIWDLPEGRFRTNFDLRDNTVISCLEYSPDGRWLASVQGQGPTRVHATVDWQEVAAFPDDPNMGACSALAFSPDSALLAFGSRRLKLWRVGSDQVTAFPESHNGPIMRIRFSPDGGTIATASKDHSVKLWSVATRQEVGTLHGHTGVVSGLAFSPDGTLLASSGEDTTIRLWRAISPDEMASLTLLRPR